MPVRKVIDRVSSCFTFDWEDLMVKVLERDLTRRNIKAWISLP